MASFTPYAPINVPKPFGPDIWIVDGPEIRMQYAVSSIPFPTRMTVVRLADGGLWIHSPIAPDAALFDAVDALGKVAWLVAPNSIHYWYVADWQKRYPDAHTAAVPGLEETARRAFRIDTVLSDGDMALPDEAFDAVLVPGTKVSEAVYFHGPSRTVILTDLIENFEPSRVHSRILRMLLRLSGAAAPHGKAPIDLRMTFWPKRKAVRRAVAHILHWGCEQVVMAHGKPYDNDGARELRRAFAWAT